MTLFSLLEDQIGPGVVNTQRGHSLFSNQTGLSNFAMYQQ